MPKGPPSCGLFSYQPDELSITNWYHSKLINWTIFYVLGNDLRIVSYPIGSIYLHCKPQFALWTQQVSYRACIAGVTGRPCLSNEMPRAHKRKYALHFCLHGLSGLFGP
jgi:hypothetical protein